METSVCMRGIFESLIPVTLQYSYPFYEDKLYKQKYYFNGSIVAKYQLLTKYSCVLVSSYCDPWCGPMVEKDSTQ